MKPGLAHTLIGLAIWALIAVPMGFSRVTNAPWFGLVAVVAFYLSRERRQSEEWFGSNAISPLAWRPRALRDMAWPILAASMATALVVLR